MAHDSGLCVDALNGAPGLYSARYAGTQQEKIDKILKELEPHIKEDKYYGGMTLDNPELKVQSPLYYLEWLQSGNRFLSAKAEEGSFKDDDALTKGTLVFMEPYIYRSQIYADQKGNHYYGTQESVIVYLYDLSSGNFIAKKKFYGKELKDQELFSDSENSFENKASRAEIKDWVNSLR